MITMTSQLLITSKEKTPTLPMKTSTIAEDYLDQDLNNDGIIGYALDDRVAFLETRKAAAAIGATDEWNKMEGVGFNPNAPENLYLAMSSIDNAMTDGQGDIDISDNLCGIVYQMTMNDLECQQDSPCHHRRYTFLQINSNVT